MATFPDLEAHLLTLPSITKRRKLLVFSETVYQPTGEKVIEGFRYFACEIGAVVEAFSRGDIGAITELPFALDDDGAVDTSSVLLNLAYTASGALVAAQPVEYQNYHPTPVAAPLVLEGEPAKAVAALIKELDQSA
jgi:hypothetical protein